MSLAPLALLLIGAAAAAQAEATVVTKREPSLTQTLPALAIWRAPVWRQVRIEQHFLIRITPGTAAMPPAVVEEIEEEERIERVAARKIGKCLVINSIASVHPGDGDELLLFMRDDRIISAMLEKRCNARDFYAGFYIDPNADAAICVGRDILHSRSGASCKVKRLHELVPTGYRRFP
jgi:hypothetical protein